jgi:hypothetical protein
VLNSAKGAMLPESLLPGRPPVVSLDRDGVSASGVNNCTQLHVSFAFKAAKIYNNAPS